MEVGLVVSKNNIVNGYFGTIVLLPHCMAKVEYEGLGSPSTIFQSIDGIKKLSCCFLSCFLCDEAGFCYICFSPFWTRLFQNFADQSIFLFFPGMFHKSIFVTKIFLTSFLLSLFLNVASATLSLLVNKTKLSCRYQYSVWNKKMFFWIVLPKKKLF